MIWDRTIQLIELFLLLILVDRNFLLRNRYRIRIYYNKPEIHNSIYYNGCFEILFVRKEPDEDYFHKYGAKPILRFEWRHKEDKKMTWLKITKHKELVIHWEPYKKFWTDVYYVGLLGNFFSVCFCSGLFWFRVFGRGIKGKDIRKHPLLFSEINGLSKPKIGNWVFSYLRKG